MYVPLFSISHKFSLHIIDIFWTAWNFKLIYIIFVYISIYILRRSTFSYYSMTICLFYLYFSNRIEFDLKSINQQFLLFLKVTKQTFYSIFHCRVFTLTILPGKTAFYSIQYKNAWLAASDLFHMFTQSIKFCYTFHYHVLRVQMFEKCDSFNRQ